jgi:hypothetical protein
MIGFLLKATGIWLVIVVAAIANGILREKVMVFLVGADVALPLSGVLLSILVLLVAFVLIPVLKSSDPKTYAGAGVLWVVLTLSFEFLFGHYAVGKSWQEMLQVFNPQQGELFIVVLAVTAVAPWVAARARRIL